MFEEITALHQQIREYVESQEPEYKVTGIDGYSNTKYMQTLDTVGEIHPDYANFIHVETQCRFRVSAIRLAGKYRLSCEVHVMSNGNLLMGDRLMSR